MRSDLKRLVIDLDEEGFNELLASLRGRMAVLDGLAMRKPKKDRSELELRKTRLRDVLIKVTVAGGVK